MRELVTLRRGLCLLALAVSLYHPGFVTAIDEEEEESPLAAIDPRRLVVTMGDGSQIKVKLADEPVVVQTANGKLSVPAGEVRRIVFALRLTEEEKQQIAQWIDTLGVPDVNARKAAAAELFAQQARAWQALEKAAKESAPEIAKEAEALLDKLWEVVPEGELTGNELDIVETPDGKIVGKLAAESLRIQTKQFGELKLKLADARTLRSLALPEPEIAEKVDIKGAQPDPGNLKGLEGQVGKTFLFKVTGAGGGTMYGSNPYTTDSRLSSTVVHFGLLKQGETGVVKVKILGNLPSYIGGTKNGLSSSGYSTYPGYEISKPKKTRPRK
ncbi:MAG: LCCL domain-containing protein [Pirellulaceae bacterium]